MLLRSKRRNENHKFSTNTLFSSQSGSVPKFLHLSSQISVVSQQKLYPQHKWNSVQFSTIPRGYWNDEDNQRNYLDKIGRELGVKEMDDWYNVSVDEVKRKASFISYYDSLFDALQKLYPQ